MTTSARSAIRSVILPLPSSPHWAPTTTSPGMSERLFLGAAAARYVPAAVHSARRIASRADRARELPLPEHVGELRVARQEREHDLAHGPVPVLGDDYVGLARALRVAVV